MCVKNTARSIGRVDQLAARGDGERLAAIGGGRLGDLGADLALNQAARLGLCRAVLNSM